MKIKYSQRKLLAIMNTKKSETIPNVKIFKESIKENDACVIG
ncbi:hypothetical protein HJ01_02945 [Flavobacterium frigoris PS1]|uniref:Uncharacterized protein n=1 Tax=Flavobacterium frigoris (strain PS1) TaxID=1086011 RepID=H7FV17_FLAFP|nr:hypothetical protein HJ01_02945 [Flavobacterium frigoris PS1]